MPCCLVMVGDAVVLCSPTHILRKKVISSLVTNYCGVLLIPTVSIKCSKKTFAAQLLLAHFFLSLKKSFSNLLCYLCVLFLLVHFFSQYNGKWHMHPFKSITQLCSDYWVTMPKHPVYRNYSYIYIENHSNSFLLLFAHILMLEVTPWNHDF